MESVGIPTYEGDLRPNDRRPERRTFGACFRGRWHPYSIIEGWQYEAVAATMQSKRVEESRLLLRQVSLASYANW